MDKPYCDNIYDLLAWWIFYKLDSVPPGELTPEMIKGFTRDVFKDARKHDAMIATLYDEYLEFRVQFRSPVD